jgi:hypothetical protein
MFEGMTGLFSAFGSYMSGEEGASDALARASANTFNAARVREATAEAVKRKEREGRAFVGGQRVARAKSGVAAGGSGSLAINEADRAFAMDVLAMKHRGELETIELESAAEVERIKGRVSKRVGRIGAFGSLLKAGGSFAEAYRLKVG